jgi:5-methylcytosine-specific restriction endonuclease McrA
MRNTGICEHSNVEYRKQTHAGGFRVLQQCIDCGDYGPNGGRSFSFQTVLAETGVPAGLLKPFDENAFQAAREHAQQRYREGLETERLEARRRDFEEWCAKAAPYYASRAWAARRAKVFKRDNYTCQACRDRPATEVHHLSYAHFGEEPLFELTSVCEACHQRITTRDRLGRGMEP